jgi:peptidoglycan endopeptidase LytF
MDVSQPHESAEVEADRTAAATVAHIHDGGPAPSPVGARGSAGIQRKETAAPAQPQDPTEAQVTKALTWATSKSGPGVEAVRSIQDAVGVKKTGVYDADTVKAVFHKQSSLKQTPDGEAGPGFCQSVGVIFTKEIAAATVQDADAKWLQENCKDGVTIGIYTQFNTDKTGAGDKEFQRKADEFAKRYNAVGLNGGKVAIGKSSPLQSVSDLISIVQSIHKGLAALAKPADTPVEGEKGAANAGNAGGGGGAEDKSTNWTKVKHLAVFTHGMEYGLCTNTDIHTFRDGLHKDSAGLQPSNIKSFVAGISDAVTNDVGVALFACSTGNDKKGGTGDGTAMPAQGENKAEGSFAGELAKELHAQGKDESTVYGHTVAAHTTENSAARAFTGGGGEHMFDVLYTDAVIKGECEKYVGDYDSKTDDEKRGIYAAMRSQMWSQYKDCVNGELARLNQGQKARFKIDMGMEMFQNPDNARTMMLQDFESFWMQNAAHLAAVKGAHAVAPPKPQQQDPGPKPPEHKDTPATTPTNTQGNNQGPVVPKKDPPPSPVKPAQGNAQGGNDGPKPKPEAPSGGGGHGIHASVGEGGNNEHGDVVAVQTALATDGVDPGKVDGKVGPKTIGAIKRYQGQIGLSHPDGLIEPGKMTAKHLWPSTGSATPEEKKAPGAGAPTATDKPAQTPVTQPTQPPPLIPAAVENKSAPVSTPVNNVPVNNAPANNAPANNAPANVPAADVKPTNTPTTNATVPTAANANQPTNNNPAQGGNPLDGIQESDAHKTANILRPDEMFADTLQNNDSKKHAFVRLNAAWAAQKAAQAKLDAAKDDKAKQAAQKAFDAAKAEVSAATDGVQAWIVKVKLSRDLQLKTVREQLALAKSKGDKKRIAEVQAAMDALTVERTKAYQADVAAMKHTDPGHTDESAFAPVDSDVVTRTFTFDDGETVKTRDHAVSYATVSMNGADSIETAAESKASKDLVQKRMGEAGLSSSNEKILKQISGFEGGFDTINTYDRAVLTWGFVQWTGGDATDLTAALTQIKQSQPEAFKNQFQKYGIDVVSNKLQVTMNGKTLVGEEAARAVRDNPKLTAVFAHAGKDEGIQKGEVNAAVALEITKALNQPVPVGKGKKVALSTIIKSEYGVGLLANTYVHSGSGAAAKACNAAVAVVLEKNPYAEGDDWAKLAEEKIIANLAAIDGDRAAVLGKKLDQSWGSYKA